MKISYEEFLSIMRANVASGKDLEQLQPDDLLSDLGIDSLGFATVLWSLEERFNIQVDDRYLKKINDVSTVSQLISVFVELGHEIESAPAK